MVFFAALSSFSFLDIGANSAMAGAYGSLVDDSGNSKAHTLFSLVVYAIVIGTMACHAQKLIRVVKQNLVVFVLPVLAILSAAWSQEPKRTILYSFFLLLNTFFAMYLVARFKPSQLMNLLILTGIVALFASIAVVAGYPRAGIDHKTAMGGWQGIFPHKNVAAMEILLMMIPAFYVKGRPMLRIGYIVLCTAFIVLTTSRTGWLLYAILITTTWLLPRLARINSRDRILVFLLLTITICVLTALIFTFLPDILRMMGKDPTMTGRTIIWKAVWDSARKRLLLGYGYFGFWIGFKGEAINTALAANDISLGNAENGVLQLLLELGAVGVVLLFLALARTCRNAVTAFRTHAPGYVHFYITMLVFTLLSLVDGTKFLFPHALYWILYLVADLGLAAEARSVRREAALTGQPA